MRVFPFLAAALFVWGCGRVAEEGPAGQEDSKPEPLGTMRNLPVPDQEETADKEGENASPLNVPDETDETSSHSFCAEPAEYQSEYCLVPGDIRGIELVEGLGGAGSDPTACPLLDGVSEGVCAWAICAPAHQVVRGDDALECCYEARLIHCR